MNHYLSRIQQDAIDKQKWYLLLLETKEIRFHSVKIIMAQVLVEVTNVDLTSEEGKYFKKLRKW